MTVMTGNDYPEVGEPQDETQPSDTQDFPAEAESEDTAEQMDAEAEDGHTDTPPELKKIKTDIITVSVPLDAAEREAVGTRMAEALKQIKDLEDDLDGYRKNINAQIKSLQKDAETASREWRNGSVEQEVICDVMGDYDACELVWLNADGKEVQRRPMTAEERQLPLPLEYPAAPEGETIGTPHATNKHTCLDCANMIDGEGGRQAEACASCSQSGSGEADNWTPRHECRTCAHSHNTIDVPPCGGCSLNVMPEHRGDEDRWESAEADEESGETD